MTLRARIDCSNSLLYLLAHYFNQLLQLTIFGYFNDFILPFGLHSPALLRSFITYCLSVQLLAYPNFSFLLAELRYTLLPCAISASYIC